MWECQKCLLQAKVSHLSLAYFERLLTLPLKPSLGLRRWVVKSPGVYPCRVSSTDNCWCSGIPLIISQRQGSSKDILLHIYVTEAGEKGRPLEHVAQTLVGPGCRMLANTLDFSLKEDGSVSRCCVVTSQTNRHRESFL